MVKRILQLMESRHITAAELTREISLANGVITQWKSGKSKPSTDAIVKLAHFFDVSTDYLLTGTEKESSLSDEEKKWLIFLRSLSTQERHDCFTYMQGFLDGASSKQNG